MAVFVGSNSDDSRIRSNRVGFAASTSNPGSPAEGDAYYNSTDNKLNVYDGSDWAAVGSGGGTIELVASGSLSNGRTVIITSDGKAKAVQNETTNTPDVGTGVVYDTDVTYGGYTAAAYDSTNNRVVIAYLEDTGTSEGKAVVGTIDGTSITFGDPVVFESAYVRDVDICFDSEHDKVVIAYQDQGNSEHGTAIVGTVSGTSISFGSASVFNSSNTHQCSIDFDSNAEKVVIAYKDQGNSNYGTCIVGNVSGTSISFGSETVFESASTANPHCVFDSSNNKMVILYKDSGNSEYYTALVGTVSGTSISFGSPTVYTNFEAGDQAATFDSTNNKIVSVYRGNNSNKAVIRIGTVTGTGITFGPVNELAEQGREFGITYDSNNDKVVIGYKDQDHTDQRGRVITGTVSGDTISFGSTVVFETDKVAGPALAYDSTNDKVVIAYTDDDNSDQGKAVVISNAATNLTSTNFVGFSDAAYSDGATATIQVAGSVDDAQSGLTTAKTHYVQNDGTLSTTAGSPSVEAGTAVSATQIIVKG